MTFSPRGTGGFSIIELMTVIGIMVLLAGLLIAVWSGIQSQVDRQRVETLLAELDSGLSNYQTDRGIFPPNPPSEDRDSSGIEGAAVLYKHLSGDWDLNGEVDENEVVYVQRLAILENQGSRDRRSTDIGGRPIVIDSYANPIRYLAELPNLEESQRSAAMRNSTYDLWSIADGDPSDPSDEAKFIKNW